MLFELRRLSEALQSFSATAAGNARSSARGVTAVHACLIKLHFSPRPAFSLWNKLLNIYFRCGHFNYAHNLFGVIPHRDVVSYNTVISSFSNSCSGFNKVSNLYDSMLEEGIRPNSITFCTLLSCCNRTKDSYVVEKIHGNSVKFGLNSDVFVGSGLVNAYSRFRGLDEALRSFEEIAEPDVVSWNVIIDACARSNSKRCAMEIFSKMRCLGDGRFDCFTLTSVLKTCFEKNDSRFGVQLHACAVKTGLAAKTPIGNALVTMYCGCEEEMNSFVQVFEEILEPNIISWTAMISGSVQNEMPHRAIGFYKKMLKSGVVENEFCYASILPALSAEANLEYGRQVHAKIIKSDFAADIGVGNALVHMYFKCGSLADAELAFEKMKNRDSFSWTIRITGFGHHGKARESLRILHDMRNCDFIPDGVTFLAVLSACSHGGLVDEGLEIFRFMVDEYRIMPKREHYACVVDMLGRTGRLSEAERFIRIVGLESDSLAWEALLGACRLHGDLELGERSAKNIMNLGPHKDGPYISLSNIYAESRKWEEKTGIRNKLDASNLKKDIGRSWYSMSEA